MFILKKYFCIVVNLFLVLISLRVCAQVDFEAVRTELLTTMAHPPPARHTGPAAESATGSGTGAAAAIAASNVAAYVPEERWWDGDGSMASSLLRLALHAASTYDPGNLATPELPSPPPSSSSSSSSSSVFSFDEHVHRPASGGTNNCGFGGATLRFAPEANDPQNHGLAHVSARLWSATAAMRQRHPRLSQADLWVLAAYAAVEALGGPRIGFVGGRFDAPNGARCPVDERPPSPARSAVAAAPARAAGPGGWASRLLPLDCGPAPVSVQVQPVLYLFLKLFYYSVHLSVFANP
jgi:hypothetical protein